MSLTTTNLLIQTNKQYKEKLKTLCLLIEKQIFHQPNSDSHSIQQSQITTCQTQINQIHNQITSNPSVQKILHLENELKKYKGIFKLFNIKHSSLQYTTTQQLTKIQNIKEENSFTFKGDKLKHLKEELSLMIDYNKNLILKHYKQNELISSLKNNINYMKENIESKKQDQTNQEYHSDINEIHKLIKEVEIMIGVEKDNYINKINTLDNNINKLNEEIELLKNKIKYKKQQYKCNTLAYQQTLNNVHKTNIKKYNNRVGSSIKINDNINSCNNNGCDFGINNVECNKNEVHVSQGFKIKKNFQFKKNINLSYNNSVVNCTLQNSKVTKTSFTFSKEKRKQFIKDNEEMKIKSKENYLLYNIHNNSKPKYKLKYDNNHNNKINNSQFTKHRLKSANVYNNKSRQPFKVFRFN